MSSKRILLIGSGERVRKAALPVFEQAPGFEIEGVVSRTPKTIESGGREYDVRGMDSLTPERMSSVDLVYMVVKKPAVPPVLKQLAEFDRSKLDILIETPVMLVRHLGHRSLLDGFRNAWVSEDCEPLPCLDAVKSLVQTGEIGDLKSAHFDRSAYAYHGMAMIKSALGGGPIKSARQRKLAGGARARTVTLANGRSATVNDPRDYAVGTLTFQGASGSVSDAPDRSADCLPLEAIVDSGVCRGFQAGSVRREFSESEVELMGEPKEGIGVTAWMDGMKRVGFLKLMERIRSGEGAYPLNCAIEDSVVDYYLEKAGRYMATPLTRPNSAALRIAFSLLTKITDR